MMRFALVGLALATASAVGQEKKTTPEKKEYRTVWKKTTLDSKFRSEGVAVADVNRDGKKDILVGDFIYIAPDWKPVTIRKDRAFDPKGYSEAFAVFADDVDGDGFSDQIVIGWPGKACHWYRNPGKTGAGGAWSEHMIQDDACNETPLYVDLLKSGKRGLLLSHKGEVCFFTPGKDVTKPWDRRSISGPGPKIPGTDKYSHGFGASDVNGDGRADVLVNGGWWEQPAKLDASPWKFRPASFPNSADMYALDVDGDGKNDIVSSSAHNTGFWWHQQKAGKDHPSFVKQDFFPLPASLVKPPEGIKLTKDELDVLTAVNKVRADAKRVGWRTDAKLCGDARTAALLGAASEDKKPDLSRAKYPGEIVATFFAPLSGKGIDAAREFAEKFPKIRHPGYEVGVGIFQGASGTKFVAILVGDRGHFALPGQTHALNHVDMNGDGVKDFVTGRRFWAHGPNGDDHPGDPAFLYWFEVRKDKTGMLRLTPHLIDDDSGVGTQFSVEDVNGDGKPDVIVSNKRGVFLFIQEQELVVVPRFPPPDDE